MEQAIMDPSWMDFNGGFDAQVKQLLQVVRLSRDQVENLTQLYQDLENTLRTEWPGCNVQPFGSIITGLGIQTSDADCYVALPDNVVVNDKKSISIAKRLLSRHPNIFQQIFGIFGAKVPIVKFYHSPTGRHCDVNFKSPSGVKNSQLIGFLLHMDPRALPLAILVKYWSKVHKFTGTNLMPNYALTMFVIFYLQQVNILPPVNELQQAAEVEVIANWDTAFAQSPNFICKNKDSLFKVLKGFFEYYSNFNYQDNIISPFIGQPIRRDLFKHAAVVPIEFELYKKNLSEAVCMPLKLESRICVQDPFEHNRNCTVAVYPRLAEKIYAFFKLASNTKGFGGDGCTYLKTILTSKPQGLTEEEHVQRAKYPNNHLPQFNVLHKKKDRIQRRPKKNNIQKNVFALYQQYIKKRNR